MEDLYYIGQMLTGEYYVVSMDINATVFMSPDIEACQLFVLLVTGGDYRAVLSS